MEILKIGVLPPQPTPKYAVVTCERCSSELKVGWSECSQRRAGIEGKRCTVGDFDCAFCGFRTRGLLETDFKPE